MFCGRTTALEEEINNKTDPTNKKQCQKKTLIIKKVQPYGIFRAEKIGHSLWNLSTMVLGHLVQSGDLGTCLQSTTLEKRWVASSVINKAGLMGISGYHKRSLTTRSLLLKSKKYVRMLSETRL